MLVLISISPKLGFMDALDLVNLWRDMDDAMIAHWATSKKSRELKEIKRQEISQK